MFKVWFLLYKVVYDRGVVRAFDLGVYDTAGITSYVTQCECVLLCVIVASTHMLHNNLCAISVPAAAGNSAPI